MPSSLHPPPAEPWIRRALTVSRTAFRTCRAIVSLASVLIWSPAVPLLDPSTPEGHPRKGDAHQETGLRPRNRRDLKSPHHPSFSSGSGCGLAMQKICCKDVDEAGTIGRHDRVVFERGIPFVDDEGRREVDELVRRAELNSSSRGQEIEIRSLLMHGAGN